MDRVDRRKCSAVTVLDNSLGVPIHGLDIGYTYRDVPLSQVLGMEGIGKSSIKLMDYQKGFGFDPSRHRCTSVDEQIEDIC
ncbi:hypothetical protein E4U54_000920 [Claviceps lovelessii]|nr:hypothetical protein E4U54_000920 [Claviceps lovelessii]